MQRVPFLQISQKQCYETALVFILIFCVAGFYFKSLTIIPAIGGLSLLTILSPMAIRPLAWFWQQLGYYLGKINSTILLTIIFFLIITPISLIRSCFSFNRMTNWKGLKNLDSNFVEHNKSLTPDEFTRTF